MLTPSCSHLHVRTRAHAVGGHGAGTLPRLHLAHMAGTELLLDKTILKWESSCRKRYGMVAACSAQSFRFVLRKATSVTTILVALVTLR